MAACAPETEIRHKRHRSEDFSNFEDSYYHYDQNLQKRSRLGILSEILDGEDGEGLNSTVVDELVLHVMTSLQEEINGLSEILSSSSSCGGYYQIDDENSGEVGESVNSYEYLVSATDDELGIPPSPSSSVDENDSHCFSNKFWNELFRKSSTETDSTAPSEDLFQPCLSHCYSYNYRDYREYNGLLLSDADQQEWIDEDWD